MPTPPVEVILLDEQCVMPVLRVNGMKHSSEFPLSEDLGLRVLICHRQ